MPRQQVSELSRQIEESKQAHRKKQEHQLIPKPPTDKVESHAELDSSESVKSPSTDNAESHAEPESSESESQDEGLRAKHRRHPGYLGGKFRTWGPYDQRTDTIPHIYGQNPGPRDPKIFHSYFTKNAESHAKPKFSKPESGDENPWGPTHAERPRLQNPNDLRRKRPPPPLTPDIFRGKGPDPLQSKNEAAAGSSSLTKDNNSGLAFPRRPIGNSEVSTSLRHGIGGKLMGSSVSERAKPEPRNASSAAGGTEEAMNSNGKVTDVKIGEMEDWLMTSENPIWPMERKKPRR